MQLDLLEEKRSKKIQLLIAMMSRPGGATNFQLNSVMFRFGARIKELRDQGYQIETTCLKKGLFNYKIEGKI